MKTPALSIRQKLTLWYAGALALVLLVFSVLVLLSVRSRMISQVDNLLKQDFETITNLLHEEQEEELQEELEELADLSPNLCFHLTGETLTHSSARWKRDSLADSFSAHSGSKRWSWVSRKGNHYRLRTTSIQARGKTYKATGARSVDEVRRTLRTLLIAMFAAGIGALVLAVLGGSSLAARALAPVSRMTSQARLITAENLSQRLPLGNPNDEFGQLTEVLNGMLKRLEDSFETLRRFTADASHELRTPLTALRSIGEVGLQKPLDPAAYQDLIGSMLEESDRLTHLVDSLLTLTRGESGHVELILVPTELGSLVKSVAEWLGVLAEEKQQTLQVQVADAVWVSVDAPTIRQALLNLVDNAIRYTPEGGMIQVRAFADEQGQAVIEVQDNGSGIPKEQQSLIFERFYCLEKSRSREMGGNGLGLAIARWEVQANKGQIEVESDVGKGSLFRIRLPLVREEE